MSRQRTVRMDKKKLGHAVTDAELSKSALADRIQIDHPDIYVCDPPRKLITRAFAEKRILHERAQWVATAIGYPIEHLLHATESDALPLRADAHGRPNEGTPNARTIEDIVTSADRGRSEIESIGGDGQGHSAAVETGSFSLLPWLAACLVAVGALFAGLQVFEAKGDSGISTRPNSSRLLGIVFDAAMSDDARQALGDAFAQSTTTAIRFTLINDASPQDGLINLAHRLGAQQLASVQGTQRGRFTIFRLSVARGTTESQVWIEAVPTVEISARASGIVANAAAAIAQGLSIKNGPQPGGAGTSNRDAFDDYMFARAILDESSGGSQKALDRAFRSVQMSIDKDDRFALAFAAKCDILARLYWYDESQPFLKDAGIACDQAAKSLHNHPFVLSAIGLTMIKAGKYDAALEVLLPAIAEHPTSIDLRLAAAEAMFSRTGEAGHPNAMEDAMDELERAVRLDPKFWVSHFWLGTFAIYAGDLVRATGSLSTAARLNPSEVVLANLTTVAVCTSDLETAQATATELMRRYPENHLGPEMQGAIYHYQARYQEELRFRKKGLNSFGPGQKPQVHQIYGAIGDAHRLIGEDGEAIRFYREALDVLRGDTLKGVLASPDYAALAYYHARIGELEGALGDPGVLSAVRRYVEKIEPEALHFSPKAMLAQTYQLLGDTVYARTNWEQATAGCAILAVHPDRK